MAQKYFGTYIKLNRELVKVWNDTVTLYNKIRVKGKRITPEDCKKYFEKLSEIVSKNRQLDEWLTKWRLWNKKVAKEYVEQYKYSEFLPYYPVSEEWYLENVIVAIREIVEDYIKPLLRKYCIKEVPPPPPPKAKSRLLKIVGGYLLTNEKYPGKNVELDVTIDISVPVDFDEEDFIKKVKEWLEEWHIENGFFSIFYLETTSFDESDFQFSIGVKEDVFSDLSPAGLLDIKVRFSKSEWEYSLETFLEDRINSYLETIL